jgi:diguanylate cyclase (GGDEF)-like protein
LTLLDHGGIIWQSISGTKGVWGLLKSEWIQHSVTALGDGAFILLILGFYQLYHVTVARFQWMFYALSIIVAFLPFLSPWYEIGYMGIFLIIALIALGGKVGTDHKFRWAIVTFLINWGLQVWEAHFSDQRAVWEPFVIKVLPVLSYSILFFILLERVIEVMQKSYISSITDALTGLFNRRHFYEAVQKSVAIGSPVSVIFIDIDNFKRLNDTRGHKAGDDVLKQVAIILKEEVEDLGLAGRYGGEEMVALIRDTTADMKQLTERIRFRVEKETNPGVTVSVGYSKFEDGVSHDELIKQADQAMYQAKSTGKNRVIRYAASATATS